MNQSESHQLGAYTVAARQSDRAMIELLTMDYLNSGGTIQELEPEGLQCKDIDLHSATFSVSRDRANSDKAKQTYKGRQYTFRELERRFGISYNCMRRRMAKGMTLEQAIEAGPARARKVD